MSQINLLIPQCAMKLLSDASGNGYRVMLHHPVGPVIEVAHVKNVVLDGDQPEDTASRTKTYAQAVAASFLMMHALDDVIEAIEPENWDDATIGAEQANVWRSVWRAWAIANGDYASAARMIDTPIE